MRPVSACDARSSASWSSVVAPGLSSITSLPCRIARTAIGARSARMPAPTTSLISGSSRIARSSATRFGGRKFLGERGGEVVLDRMERLQPAAGVEHHLHLAGDVAVIDADDGERETG